MKFKLVRASNIVQSEKEQFCKEIEINSIEDLKNIEERNIEVPCRWANLFPPPYKLIINPDYNRITIYDYCIE